jgi:pectate lyase
MKKLFIKPTKTLLSLLLSATLVTMALPKVSVSAADATLTSAVGWTEALYATWDNDSNADSATVYYKPSGTADYITVDAPLVRQDGTGGRVDIPGIAAGNYDIKIVTSTGEELVRKEIPVSEIDRSGYAHFNYTDGIGGYTDAGTPKANADIIYVTNDNKNDVQLGSYTGIGNIFKNASKLKNPVIIRIIGTVDTQARDADGSYTTDKANGVVSINGLSNKISSNDTYLNMMDVSKAKNITVEGIGDDAVIEKWGFTWSKCTSIEIKNLNFTKYPEDACSTSGNTSEYSSRIWLHNNTFDVGENKYDITTEQDKHEGDGSTDINGARYVTLSYNRFNSCHKTSLHGGSDSVNAQYNITWHHNYFNECSSRMPLTRHANVHMYNNYIYKGTNCIDARASSWVFSEANYFDDCTYAYKTSVNEAQGSPVIKTYNDEITTSGKQDKTGTIYTATSRTETYSDTGNKEDYQNFDTDSTKFYYDSVNNVSAVSYLTSAEQAKTDCINNSGVLQSKLELQGTADTVETTLIFGDADTDGILTANDAALVLQRTLNTQRLTIIEEQYSNGFQYIDVDGDNKITANDAACILSKVLNSGFLFDVEK